jgi:O-antigen/teichoic acid export membrane protein
MLKENTFSNDRKDLVLKIVKFSIPSWVGFFINILSAIILTRYFQPDTYGLINTFNATGTFIMGVVCLGLDSGFVRNFFDPPADFDRKRLFFVSLLIPIITILGVSIVFLLTIPSQLSMFLFDIDNLFILVLLSGNVVALIITRFLTIYYRMEGNTLLYSILSIGMQIALKGGLIFAAFVNPTYDFAIFSSVIIIVAMVVVFLSLFGNKLLPEKISVNLSDIKKLSSYFKYSIFTWPVPSLLYFNTIATLILIRANLGNAQVGIFASVSIFVGLIGVLQNGFSTFWSGYMFEHFNEKTHFIKQVHDYVSFFTILLLCFFLLFKDVIFFIIGENYQDSKPFFAILLLYPLFLILSETTCYGISIARKTALMLIITVVSVLSNLVVIWLFIPSWGILAACYGSAVSGLLFFLMQTYYGQQYYCSLLSWKRTLLSIIIIIVLAVGNLVFNDSLESLSILVVICISISVIVYRCIIAQMYSFVRKTVLNY